MLDEKFIKEAVEYGSISKEKAKEYWAALRRNEALEEWNRNHLPGLKAEHYRLLDVYKELSGSKKSFSIEKFELFVDAYEATGVRHKAAGINDSVRDAWNKMLHAKQTAGVFSRSQSSPGTTFNQILEGAENEGLAAMSSEYKLAPNAMALLPKFESSQYSLVDTGFDQAAIALFMKDAMQIFVRAMYKMASVDRAGRVLWEHSLNYSSGAGIDVVKAAYSDDGSFTLKSSCSSKPYRKLGYLLEAGQYCLCLCLFMTHIFPANRQLFIQSNDRKALSLALKYAAGARSKQVFWRLFSAVFNDMVGRFERDQLLDGFKSNQGRVLSMDVTDWRLYGASLVGQLCEGSSPSSTEMNDFVSMCGACDRLSDVDVAVQFGAMGFSYYTPFFKGRPGDGTYQMHQNCIVHRKGELSFNDTLEGWSHEDHVDKPFNLEEYLGEEFMRRFPLFDWNSGCMVSRQS